MKNYFTARITPRICLLPALFLAAGAVCQTTSIRAPWIESLGYKPNELFLVNVGKYGYPYVAVKVDGAQVDVAFDTGNMVGLLLGAPVIDALKLPVIDQWTSRDTDGTLLGKSRVFLATEVVAFGEVWKGEKVYELQRTDLEGLIGPRFLQDKRFTLDYKRRLLAVSKSPLPMSDLRGQALPLVPSKQLRGMIVVEGQVNGRPVLIQVDTGKSRTCIDGKLVAALNLPATKDGYRIDQVRLGEFSFQVPSAKEVNFSGIGQDLPEPILLGIGADILSQLVLTVDFQQQLLLVAAP